MMRKSATTKIGSARLKGDKENDVQRTSHTDTEGFWLGRDD